MPSGTAPATPSVGRADPIDETGPGRPDPETAAALARLYDLDLAEDPGDLDLYLALAQRTGGRVLELAVGTGRLAMPLAEAGHRVSGVDNDPAMLDRARANAGGGSGGARHGHDGDHLELVEDDLTAVRLPAAGEFGLAFIALNSLLLLPTRAAQRAAVRTMADHLGPGGLAVADVWIPDADDLARFDGRSHLEWARRDPGTGLIVTKTASAIHDAASATVDLTTIFDEGSQGVPPRRWVRRDRLRLVSADDLREFAEASGLAVELVAADYELNPMGPGSERAVLIAVKP